MSTTGDTRWCTLREFRTQVLFENVNAPSLHRWGGRRSIGNTKILLVSSSTFFPVNKINLREIYKG